MASSGKSINLEFTIFPIKGYLVISSTCLRETELNTNE